MERGESLILSIRVSRLTSGVIWLLKTRKVVKPKTLPLLEASAKELSLVVQGDAGGSPGANAEFTKGTRLC